MMYLNKLLSATAIVTIAICCKRRYFEGGINHYHAFENILANKSLSNTVFDERIIVTTETKEKGNINYSRVLSSSIDRRSSEFMVFSSEKLITATGEEFDLCLQAKAFSVESKVIVSRCVDNIESQKWTLDEYGRIHTKRDDNLCIAHVTKSTLRLANCGFQGTNKNMFVINAFEDTINFRRNGLKVFSVNGDAPVADKPVSLPKRKYSKIMQQWNMNPSASFQNSNDIPATFNIMSVENSLCIEASGLTAGSALMIAQCDLTNDMQLWKVNKFGVIRSAVHASKCITRDVTSIFISDACKKSSINMFMFDANDASIVVKRNGLMAITIIGNNVMLSAKVPSNSMQQWSLITLDASPPTPSPTSSLQVSDVGNPCTSFFDDGKCDQCTGDCDNDSDCATGLRCAQRRMFSGVENVPGCSWGPNSDSILFGDHDYCKFVCTP